MKQFLVGLGLIGSIILGFARFIARTGDEVLTLAKSARTGRTLENTSRAYDIYSLYSDYDDDGGSGTYNSAYNQFTFDRHFQLLHSLRYRALLGVGKYASFDNTSKNNYIQFSQIDKIYYQLHLKNANRKNSWDAPYCLIADSLFNELNRTNKSSIFKVEANDILLTLARQANEQILTFKFSTQDIMFAVDDYLTYRAQAKSIFKDCNGLLQDMDWMFWHPLPGISLVENLKEVKLRVLKLPRTITDIDTTYQLLGFFYGQTFSKEKADSISALTGKNVMPSPEGMAEWNHLDMISNDSVLVYTPKDLKIYSVKQFCDNIESIAPQAVDHGLNLAVYQQIENANIKLVTPSEFFELHLGKELINF